MSTVCQRPGQGTYLPISVKTLHPSRVVGVSLYLKDPADGRLFLYRSPEVALAESDLEKLVDRNVTTLYLESGGHDRYQQYLRENLASIIEDESTPVQQRFGCLNEVVRSVLSEAFRTSDTEAVVECSNTMARHCVDLICREDVVATDLMDVMYHDYRTFTHSANVSYFCVLLARQLGIADEQQLQDIAAGALLHDIGKLDVSDRLLAKPGKLTDLEFDIIRTHPQAGLQKLGSRDDLSFGQLMMVYQHHERLDGGGYPVGVGGSGIHDWAKICSVADVFEALTSHRSYRSGMRKSQALEIMDRDAGKALDKEILQCWKQTIARS